MKNYISIFLFALLWSLSTGCANNSAAKIGFNEELSSQRTALARLEGNQPYAERAQTELSEINTLLRRIELGLSQEKPGEHVDLMLETAQARISSIQALYAQWEEEERLERARATYEDTAREIERVREENQQVFEGGDQ